MMRDLLLSIDNGTQSVRALLFDAYGALVAKARTPLDGYTSPQPGRHEHDAEGFWRAVCDACGQLWQRDATLRDRIAGVAVTTQRATVIALDRKGQPLRPAITWLDQRKSPKVPRLPLHWRTAFRIAGAAETIAYFQREAEANWIKSCEPTIWAATDKFLFLSGYLIYRFCGRFVDSTGAQVGYVPFDFKRLAWARSGDWKWSVMPIVRSMLPELISPGTVIGEIANDAAEATGIPRGTPLVAAAADKACEVLGAGCLEPTVAVLSYGTAATINTVSQRYFESVPLIPPYPAAIPHAYNTEVQLLRGYWMVNWFKEQFGHLEQAAAQREDVAPETLFDRLVDAVPPGSMGLIVQPYWSPGVKMPEAKGAIVGFGDVHSRAHVYRAILEGLAFALREGKERIERRGRVRIAALRVAGGGSQSDAAMQVTADVFGMPAARPHVYETSGLGAAIDAAVGLRMHPDFPSAVKAMTRTSRVFEPQSHARTIYDELYERVYRKMYDRLQPLYEAIRDITGYPAKT